MKKFLFVHQNFPGQFVHVVHALVARGCEVVALGIAGRAVEGVRYIRYAPRFPPAKGDELDRDLQMQLARAQACAHEMAQLLRSGFVPDVIVAHPGWGEALYCKDVWPHARLVIYAEYFYGAQGGDYGFDKELFADNPRARSRLRLKNTVHLHAFAAADTIYAPTEWQRSRLPAEYRPRTRVMFDGIDTVTVRPDHQASVTLQRKGITLTANDEVITFVNRNLEPYRGFHVFMRALPEIMARRSHAHCLIVGADGVSYGAAAPSYASWRDLLLAEVGDRLPADRVHFLGALPYSDYLKVLQVSSCHVYLTYPFVLSWSCLEAMSAQCVVIGSRTGPVEEVIQDGVNGLLNDFFDVPGWVARITSVLADRDSHRELGVRAREDIVRRYDLQTICLPGQLSIIEGHERSG